MEILSLIASFIVLTILEIVLGIDNIVLLSILTRALPLQQRRRARHYGLSLAWIMRLVFLASTLLLVKMTKPLFTLANFAFSGYSLFLLSGGAFLIIKATQSIHDEIDTKSVKVTAAKKHTHFYLVVSQIALMDLIFSLDSVITAIGLTTHFWIMAAAITCAILVMLYASEWVSRFIDKYPTVKMLALSFLILIGMVLVADGFSFHIPRGYVYFAMAFSLGVETLNIVKRGRKAVKKKK